MNWKHVILAALASCLMALVSVSATAASDCTGSGTFYEQGSGGIKLSCAGSCTAPETCKEQTGNDAQGQFQFCGCNSTDFDSCCTVVLRVASGDGSKTPTTYGSCPPCPLIGACQLTGTDNQPVCGMVPK